MEMEHAEAVAALMKRIEHRRGELAFFKSIRRESERNQVHLKLKEWDFKLTPELAEAVLDTVEQWHQEKLDVLKMELERL